MELQVWNMALRLWGKSSGGKVGGYLRVLESAGVACWAQGWARVGCCSAAWGLLVLSWVLGKGEGRLEGCTLAISGCCCGCAGAGGELAFVSPFVKGRTAYADVVDEVVVLVVDEVETLVVEEVETLVLDVLELVLVLVVVTSVELVLVFVEEVAVDVLVPDVTVAGGSVPDGLP